ncbi:MAG: hypothetical protein GY929_08815, partial [Actinomycetia bacterium]|nr:hypothetical protein [Actinomycetes bacterium]
AKAMNRTGFRLAEVAERTFGEACAAAGIAPEEVDSVASTGYGRHQVAFRRLNVTDLTAAARGARFLFPGTGTVLDIGGQTMKATRVDEGGLVTSFRLNDKCASGTGAFIEKTALYMGYDSQEVADMLDGADTALPISGVCAVFAESEVINHLSQGESPGDIMLGAVASLTGRSVQLLRRVRGEPEFTLMGGVLRFRRMVELITEALGAPVNVPEGEMVQFGPAVGAAAAAQLRLDRTGESAEQERV